MNSIVQNLNYLAFATAGACRTGLASGIPTARRHGLVKGRVLVVLRTFWSSKPKTSFKTSFKTCFRTSLKTVFNIVPFLPRLVFVKRPITVGLNSSYTLAYSYLLIKLCYFKTIDYLYSIS